MRRCVRASHALGAALVLATAACGASRPKPEAYGLVKERSDERLKEVRAEVECPEHAKAELEAAEQRAKLGLPPKNSGDSCAAICAHATGADADACRTDCRQKLGLPSEQPPPAVQPPLE